MPAAEVARADALLLLAVTDPDAAELRARELAAVTRDDWWGSVARHALGLALRERGDLAAAVPELRAALRLAVAAGDADRQADVRATLGIALAMAGRTTSGLTQLDRAVREAGSPAVRARALMRRGYVLSAIVGRHREALADLEQALVGLRAAGDRVWEARTHNNISVLHLTAGDVAAAEQAVLEAERIFTAEGQAVEAAQALQNRAGVAFCRGDLPRALQLYDEAAARFAGLRMGTFALSMDRADALLTAGLPDEAVLVIDAELASAHVRPIDAADLRLRRAQAELAADRPESALGSAREARLAHVRQKRGWIALRAELTELRARQLVGRVDSRTPGAAVDVARRLEADAADEAAQAWLLAAQLQTRDSAPALAAAAAYRRHPLPLVRATGWLAHGLAREHAEDHRGALAACRRGLDELDRHRATLGSSELRALASRHGADLADLALRVTADGPPRRSLAWSERWRATSLSQPRVRPGADEVAAPLAALRDNARRLRVAHEHDEDTGQLETERRRLENALRSRLHHAVGSGAADQPLDVDVLVNEVGTGSFVELVEVGGTLSALVVSGGRVRRHEVGPVAAADQAVAATGFALRQAARGRPARLAEAGARLERALLGPAARRLPGPVVVSPTSRLHGVPWGLLPALSDVPHSVVPSAALWLRARERGSASDRRVFVSGPGLTTGGAEISVVAARHAGAVVLRDAAATVDDAMGALDGCGLAHIAAHGHFRADSPLFSSLDLVDGPLAVHDFERLDRAPHRVVLSACDSGVLAPVGAGELLGLVSALLAIGTAGVVASVAVVNDEATVDVMVDVHAALDDDADLATALHRARSAATGDPTRAATAAAFVALGV